MHRKLSIFFAIFAGAMLVCAYAPVARAANSTPDAPTGLGPTDLVNGSATSTTQPRLSFTLSDPDGSDLLRYQIQVDDTSDFSSPVIDYEFPGGAQGSRTFQVGQSGGSGANYIVGNTGQTLADNSYYWRVRASDASFATSSYSTANSGAVAFVINTAPPTTVVTQSSDGGSSLPWCSSPLAPGWNTSLPNGGCGPAPVSIMVKPSTSSSVCPAYSFTRTLRYGMTGEDVRALQRLMNCLGFTLATDGAGSPGQETEVFSTRTFLAVQKFQEKYASDIITLSGATKATGIFAEYSRKKAQAISF